MPTCPRCDGSITMRSVRGIMTEGCDACGGLWLQAGQLNAFARSGTETLVEAEELFRAVGKTSQAAGEMNCPHCDKPLYNFELPQAPGVRLDACPECRGVWIDDRELADLSARLAESGGDAGASSARASADTDDAEGRRVPCPSCHEANYPNAVACWACGTVLSADDGAASAQQQPQAPAGHLSAQELGAVRGEIARWRDKGLVSGALAARLLDEYEPKPRAPRAPASEDDWPRLVIPKTPGMLLLYLGGLLILTACIMLLSHVWDDLGDGGRAALAILAAAGVYGGGVYLRTSRPEGYTAGTILLFFGCLLVIPALLITLDGLNVDLQEGAALLVAFVSLAIHLTTLWLFGSPVLTIPYSLCAIWVALQTVAALEVRQNEMEAVAAALILCGLALLAMGWYEAARDRPGYAALPDATGMFCFLTGLVILGADGHKIGWELLALLASLGAIAGSLYRRNQTYLYLGSLYLMVNIFWIGFEYFEDTVGLPITLIICGGLCIGIGWWVHRLRDEHLLDAAPSR